jgi:hypothetical protein
MWRLLQWFGLGPRCERCGLWLRSEHSGGHARFSLDAQRWAERCKAIAIAGTSPFECPHLKRAAHEAVRPRSGE